MLGVYPCVCVCVLGCGLVYLKFNTAYSVIGSTLTTETLVTLGIQERYPAPHICLILYVLPLTSCVPAKKMLLLQLLHDTYLLTNGCVPTAFLQGATKDHCLSIGYDVVLHVGVVVLLYPRCLYTDDLAPTTDRCACLCFKDCTIARERLK
jgi:hypothetical protein